VPLNFFKICIYFFSIFFFVCVFKEMATIENSNYHNFKMDLFMFYVIKFMFVYELQLNHALLCLMLSNLF
jgi:hypothetical protein